MRMCMPTRKGSATHLARAQALEVGLPIVRPARQPSVGRIRRRPRCMAIHNPIGAPVLREERHVRWPLPRDRAAYVIFEEGRVGCILTQGEGRAPQDEHQRHQHSVMHRAKGAHGAHAHIYGDLQKWQPFQLLCCRSQNRTFYEERPQKFASSGMGCMSSKTEKDGDVEFELIVRSIEIEKSEGPHRAKEYLSGEMAKLKRVKSRSTRGGLAAMLLVLRSMDLNDPEHQRSKEHIRECVAKFG